LISLPTCLTFGRILLLPPLWLAALAGSGRLVAIGLVLAGLSDALDGYLARRLGQATALGVRLDALADSLLLISAAAWLTILHPALLREGPLLVAVAGIYVFGSLVSAITSGSLVDPRQLSSKVAGGALYGFALFSLASGIYEPVLLRLATFALMMSSAETIFRTLRARRRADITRIQASGSTSRQRSHSPHAENDVGRSASPRDRAASSATPIPSDTRS
jgi:cardiolipin synthase